jgi:hypothetical protein
VSNSVDLKLDMLDSETSWDLRCQEKSRELGGAGSIDV